MGALGAALAIVLANGVALAGHNEPKQAKKFQSALVRAYAPCVAPNDATPNLVIPACSPAVALDPVCGIDASEGKGSLQVTVLAQGDLKIKVNVTELTGCDGETLDFVTSARLTTDNCAGGGDCTAVDLIDLVVGSCVVANGKCKINTTVNTVIPGALTPGNNLGIEILGCGLVRTTGVGAPARTLSCGVLVK